MSVQSDSIPLNEVIDELGKIPGMSDLIASERARLAASELAETTEAAVVTPVPKVRSMNLLETSTVLPASRDQKIEHEDFTRFTIGEMAVKFGVSLKTLRFYEDRHLLRPHREGGMLLYGPVDRLRLQMIIKGKQLGFTLTEIAQLIGTTDESRDPADASQLENIERQRRELDEAFERLRSRKNHREKLVSGSASVQNKGT
jgi:DNA-binding transcriptional MerR regulator